MRAFTRTRNLRTPMLLVVTALVLSAGGCSLDQENATLPTQTQPLRSDVVQSPSTVSTYEQYIGSGGGTVVGDHAKLTVPPSAVTTATRFSLEITESSSEVVVECGPDGIQFAVSVTLQIDRPTDADTTDTVTVEWFDPSTSTWEDIGGTTVGDHMEVDLNHFSKYRAILEQL